MSTPLSCRFFLRKAQRRERVSLARFPQINLSGNLRKKNLRSIQVAKFPLILYSVTKERFNKGLLCRKISTDPSSL